MWCHLSLLTCFENPNLHANLASADIIFIANTLLAQLTSNYITVIAEYILVDNEWKCKTTHEMSHRPGCVHARHRPKGVTTHQSEFGMLSVISADPPDHRCGEKGYDGSWCEYTSFDFLTYEIKKYIYRIPEWVTRGLEANNDSHIRQAIFYKDQVLLRVMEPKQESGSKLVPLVAMSISSDYASQSASLPTLSTAKSEDPSENESFESWAGQRIPLLPEFEGDNRFEELDGDEDFVVLSGREEVMILCFDQSVVLPEYTDQRESSEDT